MNLAGAREFLTLLEARVPAPVAHRHCLTLENGRFMVCMFERGEEWQAYTLDETDCGKAPAELLEDLLAFRGAAQ